MTSLHLFFVILVDDVFGEWPMSDILKTQCKELLNMIRKLWYGVVFAASGVGTLHLIDGILTAKKYQKILKFQMLPSSRKLFPDGEFIFQQDNDPKHTSKLVQEYLGNETIELLDWPAQSPDLNPIAKSLG